MMKITITFPSLLIFLTAGLSDATQRTKLLRKEYNDRRSLSAGILSPIDGGYSSWQPYSLCNSVTCTEAWTRYCNNPRPQYGGATCEGESFKKEVCRDTSQCVRKTTKPPPKPTEKAEIRREWSKWGSCSVTCGTGIRTRTRLPCDDHDCDTQQQPCIKAPCSSDSELEGYGDWEEWSECANCVRTRQRFCARPDICGYKIDIQTEQCPDCNLDSDTMTECQKMLHHHTIEGNGGYKVECTEEGHFTPRQCDQDTESCWCVEKQTGRHIFGTDHLSHLYGIYDCATLSDMTRCRAMRHVSEINSGEEDYRPQCDAHGNFLPVQISHQFEIQWCVHTDGLEVDSTRVSINQELSCDPELTSKTKCQSTPEMECTESGEFSSRQCLDEMFEDCICVYANGLIKEDSHIPYKSTECSKYADLKLTKCHAITLISPTVTCLPSGEFASEHCSQEVCYCVDREGTILPNTGSPADSKRLTSCGERIKMDNGNHDHSNTVTNTPIFNIGSETTTMEMKSSSTLSWLGSDFTTAPSTFSSYADFFSLPTSEPQAGRLEQHQYSEWSDWNLCSVECGGGYRYATRSCPIMGNACGGPDIATRWDFCNDLPCVTAEIADLFYEWSSDDRLVTITCKATGLPKPYVVLRNVTGFISEDNQIEYSQVDDAVQVKYQISPLMNTSLTCIATGEGQDRRPVTVPVTPGWVESFTSSSAALYLGQKVSLRCSVSGRPKPGVRLTAGDIILEESNEIELYSEVSPRYTTVYTCYPVFEGKVYGRSLDMEVLVIDPCEGVECQEHAVCEVLEDSTTTCSCKTCDKGDFDSLNLVCGDNCQTYLNMCELEKESCLQSSPLNAIFNGSCSEIAAPVITSSCPASTVEKGSDVLLQCSVSGMAGTPTWTKDGVELGHGDTFFLSDVNVVNSGVYTCSVSGCGGTTSNTCQIEVKEMDNEVCTQYGAGHFHQFSGAAFDYPGVCHYILAMDCHYGSFYIYTGTTHCGSKETPLAYASSITVYVGWEAVVLLRGFDVNEFGVMKHLRDGDRLIYQNFRIWRESDQIYLVHPSTNFTLSWDGLTVVTLTMSKSYSGKLCGLCGDVGVEYNEVEDARSHGADYEVDRYDTCNVADIPTNTCSSEEERQQAHQTCHRALHSESFTRCHGVVGVEEYMESCVYDSCGVKWLNHLHSGLCNVLSAYSVICERMGVDVSDWRLDTPCSVQLMHKISYMSKKRRKRKKRSTDLTLV